MKHGSELASLLLAFIVPLLVVIALIARTWARRASELERDLHPVGQGADAALG